MENYQGEEGMIPVQDQQYAAADHLGLTDFMDEANSSQFVDLIRGENYDYTEVPHPQNVGGVYGADGHIFPAAAPSVELLDFFDAGTGQVADINHCHPEFSLQNAGLKVAEERDHEGDGILRDDQKSSATTTTTISLTKTKNNKVDRSKTLISERRRRGMMKEKLYALRSLVPNISKMDKASIVGDAKLYVQDLQSQATNLKAEIACLEQSLSGEDKNQVRNSQSAEKMDATSLDPILMKKIFKMDVFQVEDRGFYVRLVCNKGKGVAAFLFKALESLTNFSIQSSNLAASPENYVLTFTMHMITEQEMDVSLPNVKLWIASVFLYYGFEFEKCA